MAKQKKSGIELLVPVVLIAILGIIVTVYIAGSVQNDSTSTVTRASRSTTLTPDDDILSLEEDLKLLGVDPASEEFPEY